MLFFSKLIASFGGVGYIRPASATWGSAAAGIVLFFIFPSLSMLWKLVCIASVFLIGMIVGNYLERHTKMHDPHFLVLDEVVGMMIVTFFLQAVWWQFILAFILFRIFDIAKLWPASIFDKKKGGFAAMFDDVLMAIPALMVLHLILLFL